MGTPRSMAVATANREIEESQQRAIAARQAEQKPRNALEAMAVKLKISPQALQKTLRSTVFSACRTDEEFFALVVVANEYGLNPLLKEMYAFPAKGGGIVPMVSVDGWIRIMNEHPAFDGIEFDYHADERGGIEAIEAIIYRKDRQHPVKVIEYLEECKRPTDPWKTAPRRMLRHRALMQGARVAFGFSGIFAEGDEEIEVGNVIDITPQAQTMPDRKTLGEELGDEIPNFDRNTGEVIEDAQTDARGMTEVDEETARQADTGEWQDGRADEDMGEAHSDAEESPSDAKLRQIRESIAAAKNLTGLKHVDNEWVNARAVYDDDTAREVDAAIAAKRKELGQ